MAKKLLTVQNRKKIHKYLKEYLDGVLAEEERITDYKEAYKEAYRVEVYNGKRNLTVNDIEEWLRGLPLGTQYMTYYIVCMLLKAVTGKDDYDQLKEYAEDDYDLDCFYWHTLAEIIYTEGRK